MKIHRCRMFRCGHLVCSSRLWPPCHRAHRTVIGCLLSFSSSSAVASRPNQTWPEAQTFRKAEAPSCCVAQLKALIGVCICCCSVRACVFPNLTAELPPFFLFIFAFEKAATVSLDVVQRRVCVCVCVWMRGSGKSTT